MKAADPSVMPYVACLRWFRKVAEGMFGSALSQDFKESVARFMETFSDLGISVTPKVHALHHAVLFCDENQEGLALYGEQAIESSHKAFKSIWARKPRKINHPDYGSCLLRAVIAMNSQNLKNY